NGSVKMSTIDDKLVRRYTKMIEFGIFDRPVTTTPIPAKADGAVSRHLAEEGMVLLKNSGNLLPLNKSTLHSIALIGNDSAKTGGGGSSHVKPLYTVKPSTGLRSRAGSGVTVTTDSGRTVSSAVAKAKAADVAIVMVQDSEGEGKYRPNLTLPNSQDALVSAVS